jgi:hypothetical protein
MSLPFRWLRVTFVLNTLIALKELFLSPPGCIPCRVHAEIPPLENSHTPPDCQIQLIYILAENYAKLVEFLLDSLLAAPATRASGFRHNKTRVASVLNGFKNQLVFFI